MKAHFIYGFNVSDGGKGTIDTLIPFFADKGFEIGNPDGKRIGLFNLRSRNEKLVKRLLPTIKEGDVLICHSNGCLIGWMLIEAGAPVKAIICIQPALRRDTIWREDVKVLCTYNKRDWVVSLGRIWGRFASVVNPFRDIHGWGAAGKHGFDTDENNITHWDLDEEPEPAPGHSEVFERKKRAYWGPKFADWAYST